MRKTYQQPCATVVAVCTAQLLAGSQSGPQASSMSNPGFSASNSTSATWDDEE